MSDRKLKPVANALFSTLGDDGKPLATWKIPLLQPLHVEDGQIFASGVLLGGDGRAMGTLNLMGFPVTGWPTGRPAGRPTSDEKHLAVFLAWTLFRHRRGGKRGLADNDAAKAFDYSGPEKVRAIRVDQARRFGVDLDADISHFIETADTSAEATMDAVVLIPKPTFYRKGDGLEILGIGFIWREDFGERVVGDRKLICTLDIVKSKETTDLDALIKRAGPVIISSIRPAPN